jgi:hypothetical protein
VFNFFGLKKKPVIEDVEVKVPTPAAESEPMTFDEALAVQAATKAAKTEQEAAALAAAQKAPTPPADVVATPQADKVPEVSGQMDTTKSTREDVIAAYKIFLGRLPESMEVVDPRVGVSPAALLVDFLASKEFLDQPSKSQLVLAVAKKILDERKQAAAQVQQVD